MRKILFAAVSAAALASAGVAFAQAGHPGPHGPFQFDANSDGVLTRQEFDAGHAARFAEMDANHDGQVTREERRAGRAEHGREGGRHGGMRHGMHLEHADANHDGNISREEFLARPTQMFERLDANHNGVIEASERPQRGQHREGHERMNPDTDGNGAISRAEHDAMSAQMFERMDANHDGRVTQEEAQAMHGMHRSEH